MNRALPASMKSALKPVRRPSELYLTTGLKLPWLARQNPENVVHALESRVMATAAGLLAPGANRDQARFAAFVAADGWSYPTAVGDRLTAAGGFNQWLYFLDDQYDDNPAFGRNPDAVRRLFERTFSILENGVLPDGATPFDVWTADVRERLVALAPEGWLQRFLRDAHNYLFRGSLEVMKLWADGRVLPLDEYLELRLHDSSLDAVFDVLELAVGANFTAGELASPALAELRRHAARHVAFANDLFSYHKECVRHGSHFNLLAVLQARGVSLPEALAEALAILETDIDRFVAIEASLHDASPWMERYIDGLKGWITGNVAFSSTSPRFRAPDAVFADLRE